MIVVSHGAVMVIVIAIITIIIITSRGGLVVEDLERLLEALDLGLLLFYMLVFVLVVLFVRCFLCLCILLFALDLGLEARRALRVGLGHGDAAVLILYHIIV